jgi:hypothetical protein
MSVTNSRSQDAPVPIGGRKRMTGDRIETAERERKALELRKAGASFDEIAKALDYADKSGAFYAIKRALSDIVPPAVDEMRTLEGERLDALLAAVWKQAMDGDLKAVDRVLRIIDQRARLLGLNAPVQVGLNGEVVTYTYVGVDVKAV